MTANHPYDPEQLLPLIAQGDERAFSQLYHETSSGIYRVVMMYVKDPHTAKELVQCIYVRIWDRRRQLGEVRNGKDYLFVLARNIVFDHLKETERQMQQLAVHKTMVEERYDPVLTGIQEKENSYLLREVISRLPPRQREVYLLADEQEMSYDEIAAYMQLSRFTVKRHLELARRFVREHFRFTLTR